MPLADRSLAGGAPGFWPACDAGLWNLLRLLRSAQAAALGVVTSLANGAGLENSL